MEKLQFYSNLHNIPLDFNLFPKGKATRLFYSKGITSFSVACKWVSALPYKRISNKSDITLVFLEHCGTCSTKHALLKMLAEENFQSEIKLMIGIFKMSNAYSIKLEGIFNKYNLPYLPEAHCYLYYKGQRFDYTSLNSNTSDFENDLLLEVEIQADQVNDYKIELHKTFLEKWLIENKDIQYNFDEIWKIRELCIEVLSK